MTLRVDVAPRLMEWAIERSGRGSEYLVGRFPALPRWIQREEQPTLKQLESFAAATYTPIGYLFLQEPPAERLPIPDLRTVRDVALVAVGPNLLDTVFQCQIRQEWYKAWAASQQAEELAFVGSVTMNDRPGDVARIIREAIRFPVPASREYASWTAAVTGLSDALGEVGLLIMINGVVGTNTHRPLDPNDFRGFTLADRLAPLVFVNGADAKAAQMFTLVHEAAHVWLGQSGIGNSLAGNVEPVEIERWCNAVAAEFLVPPEDIRLAYDGRIGLANELDRLAARYRVSRLVVLSQLHESGLVDWETYRAAWDAEAARPKEAREGSSGGNFYSTLSTRVGKRFLRALVSTTISGQTLYSDAFRMLGIRDQRVFEEIASRTQPP